MPSQMPRYKLRTLLIVLALGPMVLAALWPTVKDWLRPKPIIAPSRTFPVVPSLIIEKRVAPGGPPLEVFLDTHVPSPRQGPSPPVKRLRVNDNDSALEY